MSRWTLSRPDERPLRRLDAPQSEDVSEAEVKRNIFTAKLKDMIAWGRKNSIWP